MDCLGRCVDVFVGWDLLRLTVRICVGRLVACGLRQRPWRTIWSAPSSSAPPSSSRSCVSLPLLLLSLSLFSPLPLFFFLFPRILCPVDFTFLPTIHSIPALTESHRSTQTGLQAELSQARTHAHTLTTAATAFEAQCETERTRRRTLAAQFAAYRRSHRAVVDAANTELVQLLQSADGRSEAVAALSERLTNVRGNEQSVRFLPAIFSVVSGHSGFPCLFLTLFLWSVL